MQILFLNCLNSLNKNNNNKLLLVYPLILLLYRYPLSIRIIFTDPDPKGQVSGSQRRGIRIPITDQSLHTPRLKSHCILRKENLLRILKFNDSVEVFKRCGNLSTFCCVDKPFILLIVQFSACALLLLTYFLSKNNLSVKKILDNSKLANLNASIF